MTTTKPTNGAEPFFGNLPRCIHGLYECEKCRLANKAFVQKVVALTSIKTRAGNWETAQQNPQLGRSSA